MFLKPKEDSLMEEELYAIIRLKEVEDRLGFQKPPREIAVTICLKGMTGVRAHVARLEDHPDATLTWEEVLSRLNPGEVIVKLVKSDDTEITEKITLWVNEELIPHKPLQGLAYLDEHVMATHDAGSTAGVKFNGKIPFRLIQIIEDPEPVEASV